MFVFSLRTYVHIADLSLACSSMYIYVCMYVCMSTWWGTGAGDEADHGFVFIAISLRNEEHM